MQQAYSTLNPLPGFMGPYSQINREFSNGLACNFPAGNLPGLEGGYKSHGKNMGTTQFTGTPKTCVSFIWRELQNLEQGHHQNMGIIYIKWTAESRTGTSPSSLGLQNMGVIYKSLLQNLEQVHHPVHRNSRTWGSFISRGL